MKNLAFLLFVIWSVPLTAQNLFTPGYIVTAEGETIRGLIYEKADAEMSRRLIFKTSEDSEIQKYTTKTLSAFGFDSGRKFERRLILPKPGEDEDSIYIFAKNLLRGEIDVFVGRRFQKKNPDLFLDNNSNNASIHVYNSRDTKSLNKDEFLKIFINDPQTLNSAIGVKFREKKLLQSIAAHNQTLNGKYPDSVYKENIEHNWDIIAGLPLDYSNDAVHLRAGIYFNRTNTERNPNISFISGIIYHHWELKEIIIPQSFPQGMINEKWQLFNVMPVGIKFQGNSGNFRPYGYMGAGIAWLKESNISVEDNTATGDHIRRKFFPTLNSGIGVRTRIGQNHLIIELTPTMNNLFFNLGLSL